MTENSQLPTEIREMGLEAREIFNEHIIKSKFDGDIFTFSFETPKTSFKTRRAILRLLLYKKSKNKRKFMKSLDSPPRNLNTNEEYSLSVRSHPEVKNLKFNECELQLIFDEVNLDLIPIIIRTLVDENGATVMRTYGNTPIPYQSIAYNVKSHNNKLAGSLNYGQMFYDDTPEEIKIGYLDRMFDVSPGGGKSR